MFSRLSVCFIALILGVTTTGSTWACPFCAAVSQTFSQEIDSMQIAAIAKLAEAPKSDGETAARAKFTVVDVLKGKEKLAGQKQIESLYYGEGRIGRQFLILGTEDSGEMMWSTPTLLTKHGIEYLKNVISLPEKGNERYKFFQEYLEHEDEMLARDAYDEFANAPYSALFELKPDMNHDQLVKWLQDPDLAANRRRLYFTMLGVCGGDDDLNMLESMLKSDDRKAKAGLDALIGCYLTLAGADGLSLVEKQFIDNKESEYADTYAAIMAIRFHGTETDVIEKEKLLKTLHKMLDRPALADLVIADFARWEDWSVVDKLVHLFKTADEDTSWVRVPVIRYLMACPKPEAKEYLIELEKIDPDAMKRAQTFFPFQSSAVPARPTDDNMVAKKIASDDSSDDVSSGVSDSQLETSSDLPDSEVAQSDVTREEMSTQGDRDLAAAITGDARDAATAPRVGWVQRILSGLVPLGVTFLLMVGISAVLWNPSNRTAM